MEKGTELIQRNQNNTLSVGDRSPEFVQLSETVPVKRSSAVISTGNINVELSEDISDEFLFRIMRAISHV